MTVTVSSLSWRNMRDGVYVRFSIGDRMISVRSRPLTWHDLVNGCTQTLPISVEKDATFVFPALTWYALTHGVEVTVTISDSSRVPAPQPVLLTDLYREKVTIYNDIPATALVERHFDRHVISLCNIQGQLVEKANGTIRNVVNARTVYTKDLAAYLPPDAYSLLASDQVAGHYTVRVGDFVVFGEVDDVVEDSADFSVLQKKYRDNGFKVATVAENLRDMAVDHLMMTNV